MALEKWLAITSVALFAMFGGQMYSIYNFMIDVPDDFEFGQAFEANPKILQFISIGAAPAGVLAAVAFIFSKHYGSKQIGTLIVLGGVVLLVGMLSTYSLLDKIEEQYLTDTVKYIPIVFMIMSAPTIAVGLYLIKHKRERPKKQYF